MKYFFTLLAFAFLMTAPGYAQAERAQPVNKWNIVPEKSLLSFQGAAMANPFEGQFKKFTAYIQFDEARLGESMVILRINSASVTTGSDERDTPLKGTDWLDVVNFPEIKFEGTKFSRVENNSFSLDGKLYIKKLHIPLTIPFTLEFTESENGVRQAHAQGKINIDRSLFNLGTGEWADPTIVSNNVIISFVIVATQAGTEQPAAYPPAP